MIIKLFTVWNVQQPVGFLYMLNDASKEARTQSHMTTKLFTVWNVEQPVGLLYVLNDASNLHFYNFPTRLSKVAIRSL